MDQNEQRPDPDVLLKHTLEGTAAKQGRLKIYFGYAAGVGKTYAMLDDAQQLTNRVWMSWWGMWNRIPVLRPCSCCMVFLRLRPKQYITKIYS